MMQDGIIMPPISAECSCFGNSLLLGAALQMVFCLICVMRIVFRHKPLQLFIEDFLYIVFMAAASFVFLMRFCYGRPRWYVFAGELLGWILFKIIIGDRVVKLLSLAVKLVLKLLSMVIAAILLPFKLVFGFIAAKLKQLLKNICKIVKKYTISAKYA